MESSNRDLPDETDQSSERVHSTNDDYGRSHILGQATDYSRLRIDLDAQAKMCLHCSEVSGEKTINHIKPAEAPDTKNWRNVKMNTPSLRGRQQQNLAAMVGCGGGEGKRGDGLVLRKRSKYQDTYTRIEARGLGPKRYGDGRDCTAHSKNRLCNSAAKPIDCGRHGPVRGYMDHMLYTPANQVASLVANFLSQKTDDSS